MIHILSIHNIVRYSQKKMSEKYILYIYFKILEQTCGNQSSFCIFKDKKKKVDAARFLDARGDEKHVINLERPKHCLLHIISLRSMLKKLM